MLLMTEILSAGEKKKKTEPKKHQLQDHNTKWVIKDLKLSKILLSK